MFRLSGIRSLNLMGAAGSAALAIGASGPAAPALAHHVIIPVNGSQSSNWSGYNIGTLDYGSNTLFSAITGEWRVPTVSLHKASDGTEYSSSWIGIGGGCVNASCSTTDNTLIQTGTEQDASTSGNSYSAWWEVIPATSQTISNFTVGPGDLMYASITQIENNPSEVWDIVIKDLTRHESFSQDVPYSSSMDTAEWITETPLIVGTSGTGVATMPNLKGDHFDLGTVNGKAVQLNSTYAIQLDSNGTIEATPSNPDSDSDGFNDCSYATKCAAPRSS